MGALKGLRIWKAQLHLTMNSNDEYELSFYFDKPENKSYVKIKDYYYESGDSVRHWGIPVGMKVSRMYSTYNVVQGFEKELSQEELVKVQKKMKQLLLKTLAEEKKEFMYYHNQKTNVIKNSPSGE